MENPEYNAVWRWLFFLGSITAISITITANPRLTFLLSAIMAFPIAFLLLVRLTKNPTKPGITIRGPTMAALWAGYGAFKAGIIPALLFAVTYGTFAFWIAQSIESVQKKEKEKAL